MNRASLIAALLLLGAAATTAMGQASSPLPGADGSGADTAAERARIRAAAAAVPDGPAPGMPGAAPRTSSESALGTPVNDNPAWPDPEGPEAAAARKDADETRDTVLQADAPTLVQVLQKRAVKLDARKAELDQEEARLKALRGDVAARFVELTALRDTLDERMADFGAELAARRDVQLNKLVKAMQGMPPEAAASMAAEMDEGVVVRVINRMKGRVAAKIFAAMPAALAARVGQRLALYRAGMGGKKEAKK